jgi:HlyD family secretion protein
VKRLAVAAVLLGMPIAGAGYTYVREEPVSAFITAPVERGSISTSVKATGTVDAVITVDVSSQLSGRIAEVFVNFNDTVKAGQPLAQLDREIFVARADEARAALKVAISSARLQQAACDRARVMVTNAGTAKKIAESQVVALQAKQIEVEKEFQRKSGLARTGTVSEQVLDQARSERDSGAADLRAAFEQVEMKVEAIAIAEAELRMVEADLANADAVVEQRQAALDQADLDLERAVIRAPIDGVVIKRDVNPGQTVAVSLEARTLFRIARNLREMEVHGKIDEADVGRLKVGQPARFTVDAYPDQVFTGRVLQIRMAPEIVQNVVTYTAIISAPNPDLLLFPGMTALLRVVVSDTGEILKIPNQALRFRPHGTDSPMTAQDAAATVWIVGQAGRPAPVAVSLGRSDENSSELLKGPLTEGEKLIVGVASPQRGTGFWGIRLGY